MENKDYLKKQIDQIARVLGKLLFELSDINQSGKVSDGMERMDQILNDKLNININYLITIPDNDFMEKLKIEHKLTNESLNYIAEILFKLSESTDNIMKNNLQQKSLIILKHLEQNENIYSITRNKIIKIIERNIKK